MVISFLRKKLSTFQLIIIGFLAVILIGTILLMLPVSVKGAGGASLEEAMFTAVSAVCVTGLIMRDTASYWSGFGQAVILVMIQIGGLGIITFAAFIAEASGRRISLKERSTLQESISAHQLGGLGQMTFFIFRISLITEGAGALLLLPSFCRRYGASGIWMSVFHSISAFCNAGFDIMGEKTGQFSSLTSFAADPLVIVPICLLIVIGGVGFLTWEDIAEKKLRFHEYRMQSKAVLVTSGVLIAVPLLCLLLFEYTEGTFGERFCYSLFQAVTPRTAGFNTTDYSAMSGVGRMMLITLMLIGGSPGSTAGGMKTTTVAVLAANAVSVFRRKKSVHMFGRRVEDGTIRNAATLLVMYLILSVVSAAVISTADGIPVGLSLFETASAIGTVGLSLGVTPSLGTLSHMILMLLMFAGRVGGLTLIYAALTVKSAEVAELPVEKINVG